MASRGSFVTTLKAALCGAAAAAMLSCVDSGTGTDANSRSLLRHDTVVDLALELGQEAMESLAAAGDRDVPGRLTIGAVGRNRPGETVDVGVSIKGGRGSRRRIDEKPALRIKAAKGRRILGLEHLTLNNMVQDPTMLHEAIGYQVYADAGVPVPKTGYVRLTINGQPYGLYLHVETIDRRFLADRFGDDNGVLYEGEHGSDLRERHAERFDLEEGNDPERARLKEFIAAVAAPDDDVFYGEHALVDTPSFVSMMAAQALIADTDNYYKSNNYRIYWVPARRRWFFIPTGLDQTFVDDRQAVFGGTGMLFQKCLASVRCTAEYVVAVRDAAGRFERLDIGARIDRILAVIDRPSQEDPRKPYSAEQMEEAREGLRRFVAGRAQSVRSAVACMKDGSDESLASCGGVVLVDEARTRCLEVGSRNPTPDHDSVHAEKCTGGDKQRWQLIPAAEHAAARTVAVRAVDTSRCLAVGDDRKSLLAQRPCAADRAQHFAHAVAADGAAAVTSIIDPQRTWRVERAIVK